MHKFDHNSFGARSHVSFIAHSFALCLQVSESVDMSLRFTSMSFNGCLMILSVTFCKHYPGLQFMHIWNLPSLDWWWWCCWAEMVLLHDLDLDWLWLSHGTFFSFLFFSKKSGTFFLNFWIKKCDCSLKISRYTSHKMMKMVWEICVQIRAKVREPFFRCVVGTLIELPWK